MTPTQNRRSFPEKFWQEAEPLVIHIGVVLLLEISLLLIGLAARGLEKLFPNHRDSFNLIEQIDIWLALALLCLFGLFTLIRIIIRLIFGLAEEVKRGTRGGEGSVESLSEMSDDSTDRGGRYMIEILREGIEGRNFKATLFVYIGSLLALAPVAAMIAVVWNYQKLLFVTPVLVIVLVGSEYALCGTVTEMVPGGGLAKHPDSTEYSPLRWSYVLALLAQVASYALFSTVLWAGNLISTLEATIFRVVLATSFLLFKVAAA